MASLKRLTIFPLLAGTFNRFSVNHDRDHELRFLTEGGLEDIFSRLDELLKKMK